MGPFFVYILECAEAVSTSARPRISNVGSKFTNLAGARSLRRCDGRIAILRVVVVVICERIFVAPDVDGLDSQRKGRCNEPTGRHRNVCHWQAHSASAEPCSTDERQLPFI